MVFPNSHQAPQVLQDAIVVCQVIDVVVNANMNEHAHVFCMVNSWYFKIFFRRNVVIQLMKMNSIEAGLRV